MKTTMTLLSRFDLAQQWTVTDNFLYFSILSRWISWSTVSKSHSGQAKMKRLFFFALFSLELTSLKNWSSKGQRRLNFPHLQWRINPNSVVRPRVSLRSISAWLHANMKQAQTASAFLLPAAVFSITVNYIVSLRCELIRALPCHILNEMYFAAAFVFFSASSFISTRLHLTSNSPSSFHGLVFRLTASVWQNKRKRKTISSANYKAEQKMYKWDKNSHLKLHLSPLVWSLFSAAFWDCGKVVSGSSKYYNN